jgi:uncharacterized protein YndB with AHSA1/START domain
LNTTFTKESDPVPHDADAILEEHDGRCALVFQRTFGDPPERVWQALTTTAELEEWHPTPFELEPRQGGRVAFRAADGAPAFADGVVLEYQPPHTLVHTWGEDELRWELCPDGDDGCALRLTHVFDDRYKAARDGAGWHLCLDALASSLASEPAPQRGHDTSARATWAHLNGEYERRFDIAPGRATPPPAR